MIGFIKSIFMCFVLLSFFLGMGTGLRWAEDAGYEGRGFRKGLAMMVVSMVGLFVVLALDWMRVGR